MGAPNKNQIKALDWLRERGGDATLDKHGVVLAAGESAPFTRQTWNALRDCGMVEFYNPSGRGYGRIRVLTRQEGAA